MQKCGDVLSLELDYIYRHKSGNIYTYQERAPPTSLILCLYNISGCISSITISIEDTSIDIDFKTFYLFKGKKYDKLLKSVIIQIAKLISPIATKVVSHATNPISVYLLTMDFNGYITYENTDNQNFFCICEGKL